MKFDRQTFFKEFEPHFGQKLPKLNKDGLSFLLDKIESDSAWTDVRHVAYFLTTIWHETGIRRNKVLQTFLPIKELRERADSPRRKNQDRYWKTGAYGRGYVQITWDYNYAKFGITNYDDALKSDVAYDIAARGMRKGMFTGKKLSHYFNANTEDSVGARRIINGTDKAREISSKYYALKGALIAALTSATSQQTEPVESNASDEAPSGSTDAASPGITGKLQEVASSARAQYGAASESEKSLVGRAGQLIWTALLGVVAFVQSHPVQTLLVVLVLVLGFIVLQAYCKRQDVKTALKLGGSQK